MSTTLTADLKEAFTLLNLQRAWKWLNTNSDVNYKNYFRSLFSAYSISIDENLKKLQADLLSARYRPDHSTKLYVPKKSGILRPFSLLKVTDQIVYVALIAIVAERMHPKVKRNYNKSVFGNLYAGKSSDFFYQRWTDGYSHFSRAINEAFTDGFKWTASFDLTAYYDSIDHKVLSHFLDKLGLSKEFVRYLTDHLEIWTASTDNRIYHGHGIPQGPLPSGLLSEVILKHFDDHKLFKSKSIKYFRYVDDIRILGKTEADVRKALLTLDMVSKEVGLFPQTSKINIHKIADIEEEIKSVSLPPEPLDFKLSFTQKEVVKRLYELSKGNKIQNETRFKYVLRHADPNNKLALKLLSILYHYPHLYPTVLNHLRKYKTFTKSISDQILVLLKKEQLYEEVTATYLLACLNKVHPAAKPEFIRYCISLQKKRASIISPNLRSIVFVWLINVRHFKFSEIEKIYRATKEWWIITNSLDYIDIDEFGRPSYENLLNTLIKSKSFEVAIKAAYLITVHGLTVKTLISDINGNAQLILKKAGTIGRTALSKTTISLRLSEISETTFPYFKWHKFLNSDHASCERLMVLAVGYSKTDANAFVNQLDVINDLMCKALYHANPVMGTYTLGKIGSVLSTPTGRFATSFPKYYKLCNKIHQLRLESDLSHPIVKSTGAATRRIKFAEIKKLKADIYDAYFEIGSSIP